MRAKNILDGWYHVLFKDEKTEQRAKKRAEICFGCPQKKHGTITDFVNDKLIEIKGYFCGECLCPLSAKVRSKNETCDLGKW